MPEPIKKRCDYCNEEAILSEVDRWNLCESCEKNYDEHGNRTGFCSLDCCCTGHCDDSC